MMVEIVASTSSMFVERDFKTYVFEVNDPVARKQLIMRHDDSLWMLEKGQVLVLTTNGEKVKEGGYKCYLCGGGWHSTYDTLELPIEGKVAVCTKEWNCPKALKKVGNNEVLD